LQKQSDELLLLLAAPACCSCSCLLLLPPGLLGFRLLQYKPFEVNSRIYQLAQWPGRPDDQMHTKTLTTLQTTGQRSKLILARPIGFAKEFAAVLAIEVVNASLQRIECWTGWIVRLWRRKRVFANRSTRVEVRDNNRQRVVSAR